MPDFKIDSRDIRFVLFEQNDTEALTRTTRYQDHSREMYEMVLQEAEKLAVNLLAPLNAKGDRQGVRWKDGNVTLPDGFREAYRQIAEGGWISLTGAPETGGMGLPASIAMLVTEMFTGANVAFMFTPGLSWAASGVLHDRGSQELQDKYVKRLTSGEWAGTMCLTEPQAGSSVGDARTTATPLEDGSYSIQGNKIFISSGMHDLTDNIIHLVLARTPGAAPGTRGLSLFLVPRIRVNDDGTLGEDNDVRCTGVEEKMGIHASPTCSLSFGDHGACKGWIIGREQEGMRHMFHMMNEARLIVGVQGTAAANASYLRSLEYAKERVQGVSVRNFRDPEAERVAIIDHPNVRYMLMEARALAEGMRALMIRTASYIDKVFSTEDEAERQRYTGLVEVLTPICKAYGSDAGFRVTDLAIQVHGGYGYIREYGVEQEMRDVKIASIYEGTNSIQAIDLLARKVARAGGRDFMAVMSEVSRFHEAHGAHPELGEVAQAVAKAQSDVVQATMFLGGRSLQGDLEYPVLQCKQYLMMFGHLLLGWLLAEQAIIGHEKAEALTAEDPSRTPDNHPDLRFYLNKGHTARFFARQILPRVHGLAQTIQSGDRSAIEAHW